MVIYIGGGAGFGLGGGCVLVDIVYVVFDLTIRQPENGKTVFRLLFVDG